MHRSAETDGVRLTREGGLRILTLDRPPLNVLDIATLHALERAVGTVAADPEASALVVTGAGKAFCAGVDVSDHMGDRMNAMIGALHGALTAMMRLELPVLAAVNGAALGGGLEVALACDIVLARAGAKLGQPEVRLGVFPPFAAAVLPRRCGRGVAMDLCLSGRVVSAEEGSRMGIVQQVFPADDFPSAALEYARDLSGLSRPVLRLAKRAIEAGCRLSPADALATVERLYLDELMRLDDAREGLTAFLDKRPPVWKGA
jgi:cyclohexa-1,5-dienecarbonyl-CoA hydratase